MCLCVRVCPRERERDEEGEEGRDYASVHYV